MRVQTRFKLWKIRLQRFMSNWRFNKLVEKSGKPVEECTGEQWYADSCIEDITLDEDERELISEELIYQARKLYLPTPPLSAREKWEGRGSESPFPRILTAEAMTELRTAIRKERAERRAVIEWWLKMVGGLVGILTGLVGALIGLIAMLKK